MPPRYRYRRMSAGDLSRALNNLDLSLNDFSRIAGCAYKRAQQWVEGAEDIPPHVPVLLALMTLPGGKKRAAETALSYIITDGGEE